MGKKKKKGKARRQHTGPGEEEREPRAFVEWKRDVTRKIAEQQARVKCSRNRAAGKGQGLQGLGNFFRGGSPANVRYLFSEGLHHVGRS